MLVLIGAFTKSAQVPFHFWLPGAMAAPTPVSAFLHSATMVKAGVVVVARFAPAFADLGWWRPLLVVVGGVTMLTGGVAALRRDDAKQSLAFGTVSQLGLLVVLFGVGDPAATAAGVALLIAHALFKSALFSTIGAVEHATGSRDLRRLSGVGQALPFLAAISALCTLSMIGLPPLIGFAAKESALAALVDADDGWLDRCAGRRRHRLGPDHGLLDPACGGGCSPPSPDAARRDHRAPPAGTGRHGADRRARRLLAGWRAVGLRRSVDHLERSLSSHWTARRMRT